MAVSYNDKQILSGDATFQNRVRQSMIAACVAIKAESPITTPFHRERETFLVAVMNAPDTYKLLFAQAVANDASVISDATAAGTVALTGANVVAQAALVTDAHMDTAISGQFNSFFRTPAT
jgi:hypothetical protein